MVFAMQCIEAEMPKLARKIDQQRRLAQAENYQRKGSANEYLLNRFLPAEMFDAAMAFPAYAPTIWCVIRHLCAVKRRTEKLRSAAEIQVLRTLITCEIHLLARQRAVLAAQRIAAE